ncbi:MAG: hypothetical protein Q7T03_02815 [Deltaproteobacteria bacterium]|nr:hypothetical protein [Deltaproteobacteria bacterium]
MSGMGLHGFSQFSVHNVVFLGLIALGVGYWVLTLSKTDITCPKWGKFIGYFISIASIAGLICVTYMTVRDHCFKGHDDQWSKDHMKMMEGKMPSMPPMPQK